MPAPTRSRKKFQHALTILLPARLTAELRKLADARMTTLVQVIRDACLAEVQRTRVEKTSHAR